MKKNMQGRMVSALSAAALAVTGLGYLPSASIGAAALSGQNAKGIVSQMKIGWNLGNTLECGNTNLPSTAAPAKFATAWGQPVPTAEQFQAVKDAGFNTVRIPVTWYEHLEWDESSQMYLVNDTWMDFVKQTVDYAIDRDMFVILNVHHEDWVNVKQFTDETYKEAEKKLTDIWSQVSVEFADYDQHLIFEGMNEPRQTGNPSVNEWGNGSGDDGYTWNYLNNLNAAFVKTVRNQGSSQNKERLLMLPGYCASNDKTAISNIAIPDGAGNVALSVHAYTPYYFTMATDDKANHQFPGQSGWGADYEAELTNMFDYLGDLQDEKGAPIIIGEFSASDFNNTEDRVRWATDYLTKAKAKGIPCVLWDNNVVDREDGEAHGYLYRKGCTWYPQSQPVVEAMMAVYGITPKMGEYVEITEPPFDWANITIGSDWVELYKSEEGNTISAWKNFTVSGWKEYADGNYDFVMVYDAEKTPELVLQDGGDATWNRVASSDDSETAFIKTFTYDDLTTAIAKSGLTMDDMENLYISATMSDLTAYGLYAVPKGAVVVDPTEPTEKETDAPTEPDTTEPETTEPVTETKPTETTPTEKETDAPTEPATEQETVVFNYADLKDGEEGKIIPITDPAHLVKVIIGVTSDSSADAAWYCGGGALCSSELEDPMMDANTKFWGYKEFQWNKGDTSVTVKFDGTFMKAGATEEDPAEKCEAVLTGDTLELRHWWVASAEAEEGEPVEDVTFEYTTVTVVYQTEAETTPAAKASMYGDVTGDKAIDILDVIALNKYLLGSAKLTDEQRANADVDVNNTIDSTDSLNILKYVVEMVTAFPV